MRAFLAGSLLLLIASAAFGQSDVSGGVESIGFEGNYRPDCWTPMLVNLTSSAKEPADYEIQVEQDDIDGDTVVFSRTITLNAGKQQQKYWVYFLPNTRGYKSNNTKNVNELKRELRVNLYTAGGKLVCNIPLTPGAGITNMDSRKTDAGPGKKLVLAVIGESGLPSWTEYLNSIGMIENVEFVTVRTGDLPENPIGYEAVDAIVWLNADAGELATGRRLQAIDQWITKGGHFIVCHTPEYNRVEPFAPLLPINLKTATGDRAVEWVTIQEPEPLHRLAKGGHRLNGIDQWDRLPKGSLKVIRATAKPGALVEEWIDWNVANPPEQPATPPKKGTAPTTRPANVSPYIARMPHGMGAVTWVAQDLTDKNLLSRRVGNTEIRLFGWPHVWDSIFGWKNETRTKAYLDARADVGDRKEEQQYAPITPMNIGASARGDARFDSKAGAYVALAILFFIGYWVIAGPGGYLFLASKGRKHISWQTFALCAILATALTVGVVKLVLRGEPEVKHFTVVRMTEGQPALVHSRIGLYIPRDGAQEIKLTGVAQNEVSTIHALADAPDSAQENEGFTDTGRYTVPVHDGATEPDVSIKVPFRSTLKKLQAQWVGDLPFAIGVQGERPAVVPPKEVQISNKPVKRGMITGKLVNNTGGPLKNIFLVFRHARAEDYMLFVPTWDSGAALDLELAYNDSKRLLADAPTLNRTYSGTLKQTQWGKFFHSGLKTNFGSNNSVDDFNRGARIYLALMSVFELVNPSENNISTQETRADILRRGGRNLDLSPAITAGQLVILAESGSVANPVPVPFPLEVEGEKITGGGTVYYQFVMPLDRTALKEMESASSKADEDSN